MWNPMKRQSAKASAPQDMSAADFEKLIPAEILKLLKRKKYSEIAVGDQQYFTSVITDLNTAGFSEYAYNRQADQIFTYINKMLDHVIPIIYKNEGIVESFSQGGLTALYQDNCEKALIAAVSICECIQKMIWEEPQYNEVTIGICHGPVMIGVVGHEKRMTILTLSESKEFAGFLRSLGRKYGTRIIVTASFLEMIGDSNKKFNCRLLGYIHIRTFQSLEKVFDIFDGDTVELRNNKRKTKMVFEKGVDLFMKNQASQARLHFIEVLKMDHGDSAAKEYLLRCDRNLNGQENGCGFLEVY